MNKQTFIERLKSMCDTHTYSDYKYGDFVGLNFAGYSDYSGSEVERGNYIYLQVKYERIIGSFNGGHGTTLSGFWVDDLPDGRLSKAYHDLLDEIESLGDDMTLCDDYTHEAMSELENEAWESWAERDFRDEVTKALRGNEDILIEDIDFIESDELWAMFNQAEPWAYVASGDVVWESWDKAVKEVGRCILDKINGEIAKEWEKSQAFYFRYGIKIKLAQWGMNEDKAIRLLGKDNAESWSMFERAAKGKQWASFDGKRVTWLEFDNIVEYASDEIKLAQWGKGNK